MKSKRVFIGGLVAGTMSLGLVAGTIYGASSTELPAPPDLSDWPVVFEEDLEPHIVLGNGMTAGAWRIDMTAEEAPDYWITTLPDGTVGYIKFSDFHDGVFASSGEDGVRALSREETIEMFERQRDIHSRVNERGELWIPVYAEDGETIIGEKHMNPGSPMHPMPDRFPWED